jgi:diacylglycerol O-acyltransferase / wax synthase
MARGWYEKLSVLDEAFLAFETPEAYMHVAVTAIFEPGSLAKAGGGIEIKRIRSYVASRLHLVPRYRQRLNYVPVSRQPVWVDDDSFDLNYHVRHIALPRPGGERQLQRRCAEILERPLDRGRPLWELWFIEGLSGGKFAMIGKVHHCMVDGIAGVGLLAALLGVHPTTTIEKTERWRARPVPRKRDILEREFRGRAKASVEVARGALTALRRPLAAQAALRGRAGAVWRLVRDGLRQAPPTPFNHPVGPHRRVEWLSFAIDDIRTVRERLGGTLNDVVLATVAGALREYLLGGGTLPPEIRAVVPVNVRRADQSGELGNRISIWLLSLPVAESDARRRFSAVCESTGELKASDGKLGVEVLAEAASWTSGELVHLAARLFSRTRAYNLIVTNVPGPPIPLYLLDAAMVAIYPHLPLFENQGLSIALFSYAGRLFWGLTSDWAQILSLGELKREIQRSFDTLRADAISNARVPATRSAKPKLRLLQRPQAEPKIQVTRSGTAT